MSKLTERILFLKFVCNLKYGKIREFQEFLKFIKFEVSINDFGYVYAYCIRVIPHFVVPHSFQKLKNFELLRFDKVETIYAHSRKFVRYR